MFFYNLQKLLAIFSITLALLATHLTVQAAPDTGAPTPIYTSGTYIHKASKMSFPLTLGSFVRVGILRFDATANDIGASYNLLSATAPIAINVYVYPKPEVIPLDLPAEEISQADAFLEHTKFHGIKDEILSADPGAKLVAEGEVTIYQANQQHKGQTATYTYQDDLGNVKQPYVASAYLFSCANWFIEYRITYPQSAYTVASVEVKKFMNALVWPKC